MGLGEVFRIVRSVLSPVLSLGICHFTPLSCVQAGHAVGVDGLSGAPDVTDGDHAVIPTPVGVLLVRVEVPGPDGALMGVYDDPILQVTWLPQSVEYWWQLR